MFTLYDNRTQLYQWDIGRKVIVSNTDICEVHFCNRTSDCSLVVEPYWEDGKYIADIPNVLLQTARPIRVYAYIDDAYTLEEEQFSVKARTKPADYVYTETEVKSYEALEKKLNEIEEQGFSEETVTKAVEGYLADHPTDLSAYATKEELPTKVSDLDNDAGYLTEHIDISGKSDKGHTHSISEVTDYVAPDLSPYAKTSDIPSIEGLATETFVTESINNIPAADFSNYYNKTETENLIDTAVGNISIPDVSTKADKEHTHSIADVTDYVAPDLTGYATEKYVDEAVANVSSGGEVNLDNYYTKGEVDSKIDAIDIPEVDFTGYATETFVNDAVAAIDIPTVPKVVSAFTNDAGYITEVPDTYATKTYVTAAVVNKADKADIPDTSNFATKGYVNLEVAEVRSEIPDVSELASKTYVNNKVAAIPDIDLSDYASKKYVDNAIAGVEVDIDLSNYATKSYVVSQVNNIDVPTRVSELVNDADYATERYVDDAISRIDIGDIDLSDYATKKYVDNAIENAATGDIDLSDYAKKSDIPSDIGELNNNVGYVTYDDVAGNFATQEYVDTAISNIPSSGGGDADLSNYYTKEETDTLLSELDVDIALSDDGNGNVTISNVTPGGGGDVPTPTTAATTYLINMDAYGSFPTEAKAELCEFADAVIANRGAVSAMMYCSFYGNNYMPVAFMNTDFDNNQFNFSNTIDCGNMCSNNFQGREYSMYKEDGVWKVNLAAEHSTSFSQSSMDWWAHGEYELGDITSYCHVRLMITWNNNDSRLSLHDIADHSGNSIQSYKRYYISDNYGYCARNDYVALYYDPANQCLIAENKDGDTFTVNTEDAKIIGFYHWGW